MGGIGSGNWYRWGSKTKIEEVKQIDIRFLKKRGWLSTGATGTLSWTCGGESSGSIRFRTEEDRLVLNYRYRDRDEEWQPITESVWLDTTPCNYGGSRKWFLCPHCHKRVAVLYGLGPRFLCRHCYDLSYSSQHEDFSDRMYRKARKIRNRLGLSSGDLTEPIWQKPKGMHWKTFERLIAEEEKANYAGSYIIAQKFKLLSYL